jgi:hypothetical protein
MNNDIPLSEQIKYMNNVEKERRLNVMTVLTINDGHLRPSLFGFTKNFDLLKNTLASWIIVAIFFGFGALSLSLFNSIGVVVYMLIIQALFIKLGISSLKEYKKLVHSIKNIQYAIDNDLVDYESDSGFSFIKSNDENIGKSLGLVAKYMAIFNSKQLLGAVILKHKNHTPFVILMSLACLTFILMTHNLGVVIGSLALLITLVSSFKTQGMIYKTVVLYFSGIKENLMQSLKERVSELNQEEAND